jgi:adenylate cyclase
MANIEIERKFFVAAGDDRWRAAVQRSSRFRQGYLANNERCSVRVRVDGQQGWYSVKAMTPGLERAEFEYPLPLADAQQLLDTLCARPLIEKTRHFVPHQGHLGEIAEFEGDNAGLIVAEVELDRVDEPVVIPAWAAREVTEDVRFYNFRLAEQPWSLWGVHWLADIANRKQP